MDAPHQLFSARIPTVSDRGYAVTADGQKFLAFVQRDIGDPLTIVTNFQAGLKK